MITHKGTQTIHTERLILRKFTIDDAQAMFENWASDEKVTRYLTWCPLTSHLKQQGNSWNFGVPPTKIQAHIIGLWNTKGHLSVTSALFG